MSTLHTCNSLAALQKASALVQPGDVMLLLEDAVYALQNLALLPRSIVIHVLEADAKARGLSHYNALSRVDYAGFVQLSLQHDNVIAWN